MPSAVQPSSALRIAHSLGLSEVEVIGPRSAPAEADPAGTLRAALSAPLDFPALAHATVPGDRAAIAIAAGVPQSDQLALGAVLALMDAGVEPERVTIVTINPWSNREHLHDLLAENSAADVRLEVHDPNVESACAMVGVTAAGLPLRINRTVAEADIVLPISSILPNAHGELPTAKFDSLLPGFSDTETQQRFQRASLKQSEKKLAAIAREVDEAGWLLGVTMTVQVTPGIGESLVGIFAGDATATAKAATTCSSATWLAETTETGDLVLAVVEGANHQTSWDDLARAVQACADLTRPGGSIALLTDLSTRPTGALKRLADNDDVTLLEGQLIRDASSNAWSALQLARARNRGALFLQSCLRPSEAESLGMTPITNDQELHRLVQVHKRPLIVDQANRLAPLPAASR